MKDLTTRVITAIFGIAILLGVVIKGGKLLAFAIFLMSIIGVWEFYNALKSIDLKPINIVGYLATFGIFLTNILTESPEGYMVFILTTSVILALFAFLSRDDLRVEDVGVTILGIIYVPYMLNHIFLLDGTNYIWLVFLIAFGSDTFAYFAGNLFGKHKLSPKISPNKSIEGSVGGIMGSILLTFIFTKVLKLGPLWKFIVLAVIGSIVSQSGDLIASKIKRKTGIKDFGKILPGHGGILDRFDSVIMSSPIIYYYLKYII